MIPVESRHPPGVVGLPCGELARYSLFTAAMLGLHVPAGTTLAMACGYDTSYNSNDCIQMMLRDPAAQWIWLMDDDHRFEPDTLLRLLDHDVDVVVPLYCYRQPPCGPVAYKDVTDAFTFTPYSWEDLEGKAGLLPVVAAGKGGLLVRRRALEAIPAPWFERQGVLGEDLHFFAKCHLAGFRPCVDLDTPLRHLTTVDILPRRDAQGRWCAGVDLKRDVIVELWPEKYRHDPTVELR